MLNELFKKKTDKTHIQLFRYTIVGGIAFLADITTLAAFTELFHMHYLISTAIGFTVGLAINYLLSTKWIFQSRKVKSKSLEFGIFASIGLIGLLLNEAIMWYFTEIILYHYLFSKIISTIIIYLWNFFVRKYALFK